MHSYAYIRSRCGARDGLALIVVLAFIVLLTILVVSFITFSGANHVSTSSYSKSIEAQEIAQGGIQDILSDLHQEIIAGSSVQNGGNSAYPDFYIPTANVTAVPARLGYAAASWTNDYQPSYFAPTLIRVSRASGDTTLTDFYPSTAAAYNGSYYAGSLLPINRASHSSTGTASVNGRYISPTRWNKTFLLSQTNTVLPTPFYAGETLPVTTYPTTPDLPDWVYVTRTGSRVCTNTEISAAAPNNLLPSNILTNNYGTIAAGSNPPASPIVGRYAFVMYDEGALLDINAAGYVSSATNTLAGFNPTYTNSAPPLTQTLSDKSYLSSADLTQIPGFFSKTGFNTTYYQNIVDNLVKWRNAEGIAAFTSGGNGAGISYLGASFMEGTNGFLAFQPNGATNDSPFVSRQDLINYFASIDSSFGTSTPTYSRALPYLGTFSREFNAPSYFPPLDASAIPLYQGTLATLSPVPTYHASMETSGIANRDLANVRFASAGTITHYNDDTSTSTYSVSAGDPLIQRRFSLARIGWLKSTALGGADSNGTNPTTGNGPSTTTVATAIKSCFGLVWGVPGSTALSTGSTSASSTITANGGNPCWNYVGSTGTTLPSAIETLDQVASEGREPNFFELLKAAILSGSLGKDPGPSCFSNGTTSTTYNYGSGAPTVYFIGAAGLYCHSLDGHTSASPTVNTLAPAAIPDMQIMQIGANIIDQYGSDGYPTAIYFRYLTGTGLSNFDPVMGSASNPASFGPVDMVYGDKNLPSLTRVIQQWCTTAGNGTSGNWADGTYVNANQMADFLFPELWNPHQMPATALANYPKNFQIRAYGSTQSYWEYDDTGTHGYSNVNDFYQGTGGNTESCPAGTLNFTDSNSGGSSALFNWPYLLTKDQIPNRSGASPTVTATSPAVQNIAQGPPSNTTNTYPGSSTTAYSSTHFVAFCAGETPVPGTSPTYTTFFTHPSNGRTYTVFLGNAALTYVLGWTDGATIGTGNFHPYCFLTGTMSDYYNPTNNGNGSGYGDCGYCMPNGGDGPYEWAVVDPRTSRFSSYASHYLTSSVFNDITAGAPPLGAYTLFSNSARHDNQYMVCLPWNLNTGFSPASSGASSNPQGGTPEDWAVNSSVASQIAGGSTLDTGPPSSYYYYADPDGVVRPGDGFYGNTLTGDGLMLFTTNGTSSKAPLGDTKTGTGADDMPSTMSESTPGNNSGNTRHGRRPIILNRPFRNVGELGYVFRDLPFKTLDFFSSSSADAALLDVFSITDEPKVVAGRLALNNAPLPVMDSVLSGGLKKELDPSYTMGTNTPVATIASEIANTLHPTGSPSPLLNRAGLVTSLGVITSPNSGIHGTFASTATADRANKAYYEAPVRALSDVTNTRTWNLLIDVIAQSGHLSPTATSLDNFIVEGEKRYWLHIAIDRYTGKIVDQQLEPVYE